MCHVTFMAKLMDRGECSGKGKIGLWEARKSGEEALGWTYRSEHRV